MAKREAGSSPARSRRCKRGVLPLHDRISLRAPLSEAWEGLDRMTIREPEDLHRIVLHQREDWISNRVFNSENGLRHICRGFLFYTDKSRNNKIQSLMFCLSMIKFRQLRGKQVKVLCGPAAVNV